MSNQKNITKSTAQLPAIPMDAGMGIFSPTHFEASQRVCMALAESSLVPKDYQGNVANCLIALDMSQRLGANVLAIMQSLYIVHGRPSWSSTFIAGAINTCGRFHPVQYEMSGEGDTRACYCRATVRETQEEVVGPTVTIKMAKAEGWFQKNGSEWQTMPELMLRYRAVTFFGRLYAPEILLGMQTDDEVIDVESSVTEDPRVVPEGKIGATRNPEAIPATTEEQPKEPEAPAKPKAKRKPKTAKPKEPAPLPPEQQPAPETTSAPDPDPETEAGAYEPEVVADCPFTDNPKAMELDGILRKNDLCWADFVYFMRSEQDYDVEKNGVPMSYATAIIRNPDPLIAGINALKNGE